MSFGVNNVLEVLLCFLLFDIFQKKVSHEKIIMAHDCLKLFL